MKRRLYAAVKACALIIVSYQLGLLVVYRFADPAGSNLILAHYVTSGSAKHNWVPLERVSPHVLRAVIASEDAKFCRHWGVDWSELYRAARNAKGGAPRGASTITMQTAKNLFLWPGRSYVRKAIELPLSTAMTVVWSKRRTLEIYLNIAQWGPGVFGVEAAARHHFAKAASRLNKHEAALLAAVLPNPVVRNARRPGRLTRRKARLLKKRMAAMAGRFNCVSP